MENSFFEDIFKICNEFDKFSVEYLIVGGTAVGIYGDYRATKMPDGSDSNKHDFDFWYNPTYENYYKIIKALKSLGRDMSAFEIESAPNPKKAYLNFDFEKFKIDLLPEILGLESFSKSYSNKSRSKIQDLEINIISLEDLILSKQATGRQKDIDDIENLKKIN